METNSNRSIDYDSLLLLVCICSEYRELYKVLIWHLIGSLVRQRMLRPSNNTKNILYLSL